MSLATESSKRLLALVFATLLFGCEEEAPKEAAPAKPSATAAAVASAPPAPVASAKPPAKPRDDCPKDSSGPGTFQEPCLGKGDSRMMEVKYTGKTTDEGPKFSVTNKSNSPILFGTVVAYFYDKAGKQLQVKGDKPRPSQLCSGNIFAGAVKPDEKIYIFFSCVKKDHIPEGTDAIEAEIKTVGFADESGTKNEFYWQNPELTPDERPKGGIKAKAKGKK